MTCAFFVRYANILPIFHVSQYILTIVWDTYWSTLVLERTVFLRIGMFVSTNQTRMLVSHLWYAVALLHTVRTGDRSKNAKLAASVVADYADR